MKIEIDDRTEMKFESDSEAKIALRAVMEQLSTDSIIEELDASEVIKALEPEDMFEAISERLRMEQIVNGLGVAEVIKVLEPDDIVKHGDVSKLLSAIGDDAAREHFGFSE